MDVYEQIREKQKVSDDAGGAEKIEELKLTGALVSCAGLRGIDWFAVSRYANPPRKKTADERSAEITNGRSTRRYLPDLSLLFLGSVDVICCNDMFQEVVDENWLLGLYH